MVKKKPMKKKMSKNSKPMRSKMDSCCCGYDWHYIWVKLSAMAFILFFIRVWPAAMSLVHRIHWGWFLGATVLFCIIFYSAHRKCMCGTKMM